jgi:hypothetical protein
MLKIENRNRYIDKLAIVRGRSIENCGTTYIVTTSYYSA